MTQYIPTRSGQGASPLRIPKGVLADHLACGCHNVCKEHDVKPEKGKVVFVSGDFKVEVKRTLFSMRTTITSSEREPKSSPNQATPETSVNKGEIEHE